MKGVSTRFYVRDTEGNDTVVARKVKAATPLDSLRPKRTLEKRRRRREGLPGPSGQSGFVGFTGTAGLAIDSQDKLFPALKEWRGESFEYPLPGWVEGDNGPRSGNPAKLWVPL